MNETPALRPPKKCSAITANGGRCGNLSLVGKEVCHAHDPEAWAAVQAAAQERAIEQEAARKLALLTREEQTRANIAAFDLQQLTDREEALKRGEDQLLAKHRALEASGDEWWSLSANLLRRAAGMLDSAAVAPEWAQAMVDCAKEMRIFAWAYAQAHEKTDKRGSTGTRGGSRWRREWRGEDD